MFVAGLFLGCVAAAVSGALIGIGHSDIQEGSLITFAVMEGLASLFCLFCFMLSECEERHFTVEIIPLYMLFFIGTFAANAINAFHSDGAEFIAYLFECSECFIQAAFILMVFSHQKLSGSKAMLSWVSFSAGYFTMLNLFWLILDLVEKFHIESRQSAIMQPLLVALVIDFRLHSIMFWLTIMGAIHKVPNSGGWITLEVFPTNPNRPHEAAHPAGARQVPAEDARVFFMGLALAVVASFPLAVGVMEQWTNVADIWQLSISVLFCCMISYLFGCMTTAQPPNRYTSILNLFIFIVFCFGTAIADFMITHDAKDNNDKVKAAATAFTGLEALFQGLFLMRVVLFSSVRFQPWYLFRFFVTFMAMYDICQLLMNIFQPFDYTGSDLFNYILIACLIDFRLHATLYLVNLASRSFNSMEFIPAEQNAQGQQGAPEHDGAPLLPNRGQRKPELEFTEVVVWNGEDD